MSVLYRPVVIRDSECYTIPHSIDINDYLPDQIGRQSMWGNERTNTLMQFIYKNPGCVAWIGNEMQGSKQLYAYETDWFNPAWKTDKVISLPIDVRESEISMKDKYIVNHLKKLYVDCNKTKTNPLPLLTVNFENDNDIGIIGSWVGDYISVEDEPPKKELKYKEICPNFHIN